MLTDTTLKRLNTLSNLSTEGKRINGLFRLLENDIIWKQAYINLHSNKGAITKGIDDCTLDGFSLERVYNIITRLKNNTYEFKPVRRAFIPKKNGKLRPLGIPNGDDKLIQEVAKIILTNIYEPVFSSYSHGFRPERSCHSALNEIRATWTGMKWIIVMDIKGFFDNLNHEILIKQLERKIDDKRFVGIIKELLRAGYMQNEKRHVTFSGTMQGGNLSPILANIYLDDLDKYMENAIKEFNCGKRRRFNTEYANITSKIKSRRIKIDKLKKAGKSMESAEIQEVLREIETLTNERSKLHSVEPMDTEYKRLVYNRYADDFVVGVIGSKQEATEIAKKIKEFLNTQLKLQIADEKFDIVHAGKGVRYLGYDIKSYSGKKILKMDNKYSKSPKRTVKERMQLLVPHELMRKFCNKNGYGNYDTCQATSNPIRTISGDAEIISAFNAELRGIVNYYAIANNAKKSLNRIVQIGRRSCAMTIAHKHKTPVKQVIQSMKRPNGEWIRTIETQEKRYEFRIYRLKTDFKEKGFNYEKLDIEPNTCNFTWSKVELLRRLEANTCEICGSHKNTEVHHIRKLKDIKNGKKAWEILMCAKKRKTLVLCRKCHRALHCGKLDSGIISFKGSETSQNS